MLVIKVELHHARTHQISEIARAVIYNDGTGTPDMGNYEGFVVFDDDLNGDDPDALMRDAIKFRDMRKSPVRVKGYERRKRPVWDLVTLVLNAMNYGERTLD